MSIILQLIAVVGRANPNLQSQDFKKFVAQALDVSENNLNGGLWLSERSSAGKCVSHGSPRLIPFSETSKSGSKIYAPLKFYAFVPGCGAQAIIWGKAQYDFYEDGSYSGVGEPRFAKVPAGRCIGCHKGGAAIGSTESWNEMN